MDSIWIKGGNKPQRRNTDQRREERALTLLPCALLTEEQLTLANLPRLADVDSSAICSTSLAFRPTSPGVKKGESAAG